ncbi:hypothetical protein B0H13DRAFT_2322909 [Mycena leptocephala]|nr:hypothetical protein B0H13DRAFT_2322909 [Mycena leptocephala]
MPDTAHIRPPFPLDVPTGPVHLPTLLRISSARHRLISISILFLAPYTSPPPPAAPTSPLLSFHSSRSHPALCNHSAPGVMPDRQPPPLGSCGSAPLLSFRIASIAFRACIVFPPPFMAPREDPERRVHSFLASILRPSGILSSADLERALRASKTSARVGRLSSLFFFRSLGLELSFIRLPSTSPIPLPLLSLPIRKPSFRYPDSAFVTRLSFGCPISHRLINPTKGFNAVPNGDPTYFFRHLSNFGH